MTRFLRVLSVLVFFVLSAAPFVFAQRRKAPQLRSDVELPADFSIDFQLGSAERSRARAGKGTVTGTSLNKVGEEVFRTLIDTPTISAFALPYRWTFTIIDNGSVNAHSLQDGEVSVDRGLAELLGSNRGLWAAALSHETAHTARRHAVTKYVYAAYVAQQVEYYRLRAAQGDNSAKWALVGLRIAALIAAAKLSRDLEHDADTHGMTLMARAGYHPDNVFALHHLLRMVAGEQSRFGAFFSSHPRWETRDQRSQRAYADALAEYNRLWPDPSSSPGGPPPAVVFMGKPEAKENKQAKTAELILSLYCRNATEPLTLLIHFTKDRQQLRGTGDEYTDAAGNLVFRQQVPCLDKDDAAPATIHLPANLVSPRNRKVKAEVDVLGPEKLLLERSKEFDVHFPKP